MKPACTHRFGNCLLGGIEGLGSFSWKVKGTQGYPGCSPGLLLPSPQDQAEITEGGRLRNHVSEEEDTVTTML